MISLIYLAALIGITVMVSSDTGLPDPNNPNEELRVSNEDVILVTDDDEDSDDQETVVLEEYQPLPTDESADANHSSSEDEEYDNQNTNNTVTSFPQITPMDETLLKEVWAAPPHSANHDIEMGSKKVDEVKQIMTNITLPSSSIPSWASLVPEEEWKSLVMDRLHGDKK